MKIGLTTGSAAHLCQHHLVLGIRWWRLPTTPIVVPPGGSPCGPPGGDWLAEQSAYHLVFVYRDMQLHRSDADVGMALGVADFSQRSPTG